MKRKIEIKETVASVKLLAGNGETFSFCYHLDSVPFLNLMSIIESESKKNLKKEEDQAKSFLKIFRAVKSVFGENIYNDMMDWVAENGEVIPLVEFVQLVTEFNSNEAAELPKES